MRKNSFFSFNRFEKKAILALSFLLFIVFIIRIVVPEETTKKWKIETYTTPTEAQQKKVNKLKLPTNPNIASLQRLLEIGFSEQTAKSIIQYREANKTFYQPEDLKKVRTLSEKEYQNALPYILIPNSKLMVKTKKEIINKLPEINSFNKADWVKYLNISEKGAVRIVAFRNQLGGFYSIQQLSEVIRLDKEKSAQLENLRCDSNRISQIVLRHEDAEQRLKKHPYISSEDAKKILNTYRTKKDSFRAVLHRELPKRSDKIIRYINFE